MAWFDRLEGSKGVRPHLTRCIVPDARVTADAMLDSPFRPLELASCSRSVHQPAGTTVQTAQTELCTCLEQWTAPAAHAEVSARKTAVLPNGGACWQIEQGCILYIINCSLADILYDNARNLGGNYHAWSPTTKQQHLSV